MNTVQSKSLRSSWPSGGAAFGSDVVDPAPSDYIVPTTFPRGYMATFHYVLPHHEHKASKPQAHCE